MKETKMKVLELFSGIGGMHFACKEAERLSQGMFQFEVVAAVDINTSANSVYKANFPSSKLLGRNIQSISTEEVNAWAPDIILMSPPCQPFTRTGLKKDLADARCSALSHLITSIPHFHTVRYLLLENVKGFELSQSRQSFVDMLSANGFRYSEFLLSPVQFGVPNSRTRYYLVARKGTEEFGFEGTERLITELPKLSPGSFQLNPILPEMTVQSILDTTDPIHPVYQKLLVPDKDLARRFNVLDIVNPDSSCTNCFTKAYTHYAEGTGSVLSNLDMTNIEEIISKASPLLKTPSGDDHTEETKAKKIKLSEENDIKINPKETRGHLNTEEIVENVETPCEKSSGIVQEIDGSIERKSVDDTPGGVPVLETDTELKTRPKCDENFTRDLNHSAGYDVSIEEANRNVQILQTSEKKHTTSNDSAGSLPTSTTGDKGANQSAEILDLLRALNLRYFSPNEVRKLMCFPDSMQFPATCSDKSKYKLFGNSINVRVVAYCICLMLSGGQKTN